MKWLILIAFLTYCYCTENKEEYKNEERRIAGGGNYGGFIGLTTYGVGPFLVKGKHEDSYMGQRGYENDEGQENPAEALKNNKYKKEGSYEVKYATNVGYEDIQRDQIYYKEGVQKDNDFLEYLGYEGDGSCSGQFRKTAVYRNKYKWQQRERFGSDPEYSNYSRYYDDNTRERCDHLFGFTGPTANDEPENLIRPCALDDWQCIRNYFSANSECQPAYGPIPDPLYIDLNTVFYPIADITVTLPNYELRGLSNAKVRDFYVNKMSGNLVFAVDIINLNETFPRAYFRYRRTAKESIVLADFATIQHNVTFTAVIPMHPHLRLDLADIHGDLQNAIPPFFFGPGAYNSTDPEVVAAVAQFNVNLPIALREALLTQSVLYTSIFIQKYICDFGLKIFGVRIF